MAMWNNLNQVLNKFWLISKLFFWNCGSIEGVKVVCMYFKKTGWSGTNTIALGMSGSHKTTFKLTRTYSKLCWDYYTLPWMTLYVLNNHTAYLFIIYHHFDVFWRHTGTRHLTRALTNWIDQKFTGHIRYFLTNLVFRTLREL